MTFNTTAKSIDTVVKPYQDPVPYPIDKSGANDVAAGDFVWFDGANGWIASIDTDAHAATYAGVAMDGSFIQPYTTKFYSDQLPVLTKGIVRAKTTVGDTYHHGDKVYQTTSAAGDPQTVTNTIGANTKSLGNIVLPPGISSIVGGAGILVQVEITPLFPVTSV